MICGDCAETLIRRSETVMNWSIDFLPVGSWVWEYGCLNLVAAVLLDQGAEHDGTAADCADRERPPDVAAGARRVRIVNAAEHGAVLRLKILERHQLQGHGLRPAARSSITVFPAGAVRHEAGSVAEPLRPRHGVASMV